MREPSREGLGPAGVEEAIVLGRAGSSVLRALERTGYGGPLSYFFSYLQNDKAYISSKIYLILKNIVDIINWKSIKMRLLRQMRTESSNDSINHKKTSTDIYLLPIHDMLANMCYRKLHKYID